MSDDDEIKIPLSAFKNSLKKNRRKIAIASGSTALIFFLWAITKPISYEAEGVFREKGKADAGISTSFVSMLLSANVASGNSEAMGTIKSHSFLAPLVQKLGMQATLHEDSFGFPKICRMFNNLSLEWGNLRGRDVPLLKDQQLPIFVENVFYRQEVPSTFKIVFKSSTSFDLCYDDTTLSCQSGETVIGPKFSLILFADQDASLQGRIFYLTLSPLAQTTERLSKEIMIEQDKIDSTLIKLKWKHPNRHLASKFLNALMIAYRDSLKKEHERVSEEQLHYLRHRQDEVARELEVVMANYADTLSREVTSIGFPNTEKAIDFLARWQQKCKDKQLAIDLEAKRLQKATSEQKPHIAQSDEEGGKIVHHLLSQMQALKFESDSLELALADVPKQNTQGKTKALGDVRRYLDDLEVVKSSLENNTPPQQDLSLFQTRPHFAKTLSDLLANNASGDNKRLIEAYLAHIKHLLDLEKKTIEGGVQFDGKGGDFEGIKLQSAQELYLTYTKNLLDVQSRIVQLEHTLEHLSEPHFEISSLGIVLTDEVSRGLIAKASELILASQEESNRTVKEQERLRRDVQNEKKFLQMHIVQTIELLKLQESLWKEKILSLQNTTVDLIHRQISLLDQELSDHLSSRLSLLQAEKEIITGHQRQIEWEMAKLPKQWMQEKVVDQYVRMNEKIVEEITKLVESKNISNNLEIIQSTPLDFAEVPLNPKPPRLLLMAFAGALLGACGASGYHIFGSYRKGFDPTRELLELRQKKVGGHIPLTSRKIIDDQTLATSRTLLNRFEHQTILVLQAQGASIAEALLSLLSKRGKKGVLVSLNFHQGSLVGLRQYLEGETDEPHLLEGGDWDTLPSGGVTRFGPELLSKERMANLLDALEEKYDLIILDSPLALKTPEAKALCDLFPEAVLVISDETIDELEYYIGQEKPSNFVIIDRE